MIKWKAIVEQHNKKDGEKIPDKKTKSKVSVVYVCECCGREFRVDPPFPDNCPCGNYCEDFFRPKDIWDYEDDKRGVPLFGVIYAPEVLEERNDRLAKSVVTVDVGPSQEMIRIDYGRLNKNQLREILKEKKHPLADKQAKKADLLILVNEIMAGGK